MALQFRSKLDQILYEKGIKQVELHDMIFKKTGKRLAKSTISKITRGELIDYQLRTAGYIASTLAIPIESIIEDEILKPELQNDAATE